MKASIVCISLILSVTTVFAQSDKNIKLTTPLKTGGKPIMQCFDERHSTRDYINKELSTQQLAELLWAANGINREDGRRTAPTAHNKQEIDIYVALSKGLFRYDASGNQLIYITGDDVRGKTGSQPFVKDAAVNLVYICNKNKAASSDEKSMITNAAFAAGAMSQNVYLYCASAGLGCVVRGWFKSDELAKTLKLSSDQFIIITQTVGVTK